LRREAEKKGGRRAALDALKHLLPKAACGENRGTIRNSVYGLSG
jgi:hypothetical protein